MARITAKARAALHQRSSSMCEMCGKQATNAHHRKNASQGGTDDLSNLLLLCGSGTTGCHGWVTEHPGDAKRHGWSMWRSDIPYDIPVMYRGHWARIDDAGNVEVLAIGEVRHELGHLSIGVYREGASSE